jgi:hypothetical protein
MPPILQVVYTPHGGETGTGTVAAWTQVTAEGKADRGFHVLRGYADPIVAAQLLEEALKDEGYVWIIPDDGEGNPGEIKLDGLLLIYGADIHTGRVRDHIGVVDVATSDQSAPAPPVGPDSTELGPGPTPSPAPSGNPSSDGGGLIRVAQGGDTP